MNLFIVYTARRVSGIIKVSGTSVVGRCHKASHKASQQEKFKNYSNICKIMNLVEATLVLVVIVLVAISILYLALSKGVLNRVTESQAVQLVTSDLENKYPGGIVNVTNVTPSARYPGSWHIVVSLVLNATSPCPNYVVYSYDYPAFTFIPTTVNVYTNSCRILGFNTITPFSIASAPVAIVRATQLNISSVDRFINTFGYSNVSTKAVFFPSYVIKGKNYTNLWQITYSSPKANYSVEVWITQLNGTLVSVNTTG